MLRAGAGACTAAEGWMLPRCCCHEVRQAALDAAAHNPPASAHR